MFVEIGCVDVFVRQRWKVVSTAVSIANSTRPFVPLDAPESISELALLPLIPRLLRLPFPPFSDLASFRISLFRWITGVSARGSAIFAVLDCCGSGDTKPFLASTSVLLGLPFRRFFSLGTDSASSRFRADERVTLCGCGSGSVTGDLLRRVCLLLVISALFSVCPADSSGTVSVFFFFFFGGRPRLGDCCGGTSGIGFRFSGAASTDDLSFLLGSRVN